MQPLHLLQRSASVIPEPNFPARPEEFVGRKLQIEVFQRALQQGRETGRTPSFAVLGDWGIGKSSLLLKCSVICAEPQYKMLPVQFQGNWPTTELLQKDCSTDSAKTSQTQGRLPFTFNVS
jgi:hypothetical protein